jgi:hypothetical protein
MNAVALPEINLKESHLFSNIFESEAGHGKWKLTFPQIIEMTNFIWTEEVLNEV